MSKHIDAAVKGGLVLSIVAVIVLSVLLSRQRGEVVQLNVQVSELEARGCEEHEEPTCTCEADARLLTSCSESLKLARAEITRAAKQGLWQAPEQGAGWASGAQAQQEGWDAQAPGTQAPGTQGAADDEVPRQRVKDLFSGKLGIAPEQMQPLGELVCAATALRQSLLDDFAYGQTGEAETWQQLTQVRKDLTAQMAEVLGPQKYKEFRAAGGIGALAMVVDCEG